MLHNCELLLRYLHDQRCNYQVQGLHCQNLVASLTSLSARYSQLLFQEIYHRIQILQCLLVARLCFSFLQLSISDFQQEWLPYLDCMLMDPHLHRLVVWKVWSSLDQVITYVDREHLKLQLHHMCQDLYPLANWKSVLGTCFASFC